VTEHLRIEGANVAQEAGRRLGFPVFRGLEARSSLGDMLVFGYYEDVLDEIPLDELCRRVHEAGGVLFAAHPYRRGAWSLADFDRRGLNLETGAAPDIDGIETLNGQLRDEVNDQAARLAARWGLPGIGGSDAHAASMVAKAATRFDQPIRTDADLVAALKEGHYQAVRLRY
jgi:hypothetical protein